MRVNRIYFDLDGVLADFCGGLREFSGLDTENLPSDKRERSKMVWAGVRGVDHFYGKLRVVPESLDLFNKVYSVYGDKCEILTGLPKPWKKIDGAKEDKIKWVQRWISPSIKVNAVLREQKIDFCTGRGSILIDDFQANVEEWQEAGGTGILFENADDTLKQLRDLGVLEVSGMFVW